MAWIEQNEEKRFFFYCGFSIKNRQIKERKKIERYI